MSEHLDDKLRAALRPVDPEGDLASDVLAQIDAHERHPVQRPVSILRPRRWQIPVALAASIIVAVGIGFEWRRQQEGLRARAQLIEALQVTSAKLDLVHQIVHERSRSDSPPENGA